MEKAHEIFTRRFRGIRHDPGFGLEDLGRQVELAVGPDLGPPELHGPEPRDGPQPGGVLERRLDVGVDGELDSGRRVR